MEGKDSCSLSCSHFDAFRFFHPAAKSFNSLEDLRRDTQPKYEQPGCIHASMDLFKYAYSLYPYIGADLLRDTLKLAILARKIDMRSSPYDVRDYLDGDEKEPIRVETAPGRREFAVAQEKLYFASLPLRGKLIEAYDCFLNHDDVLESYQC